MSIEAMRNAVEAMDKHDFEMADHILCQAIAEAERQEQGEPVAEVKRNSSGQIYIDWRDGESAIVNLVGTVLYTTPQQRKPLTDEQMRDCLDAADQMYCEKDGDKELFKARAIEAAHNIKE